MYTPSPSKEAVTRYGEARAKEFATIEQVRRNLMEAFDALTVVTDNVNQAGEQAFSFEYLWAMLVAKQKEVVDAERKD